MAGKIIKQTLLIILMVLLSVATSSAEIRPGEKFKARPGAADSRERLVAFLGGDEITIRVARYTDADGAWLCDVWSSNGMHVNKGMRKWLNRDGEQRI